LGVRRCWEVVQLASVERAASSSSGPVGAPKGTPSVRVDRRSLGGVFRRLWWATGISASGDGLLAVAVPLLALTLSRNPLVIAGLTGANRASAAIAALPGGLVADRWDRRSVMVACNVAAGVTLLALVAAMSAGWAELVMLYVVAVVLAACDVTYTLAVQASLPDVIPTERLGIANGRLIAIEGAGEQFIGPASGGILFSLARRLPFFVDGISFFVSAWLVRSGLPRDAQRHAPPILDVVGPASTSTEGTGTGRARSDSAISDSAGSNGAGSNGAGSNGVHPNGAHPNGALAPDHNESRGMADLEEGPLPGAEPRPSWVANFRQGLSVFRSDRALKLLATTAAAAALCQTMVIAILVLYGKQTLHLTSTGYGLFLAFAAVIGVAAAHFAGHMQQRFGSGQLILGGLALSIVSYLGLAFTHSVVLAVFVFGLQEVGTVALNVGSVTARQRLIPRQLYGRVGSVHRLAVLSASVIGALLGGFIASASSVAATMVTAGVLLFVATVLVSPLLLRTLVVRDAS
jgi:MFS family permease